MKRFIVAVDLEGVACALPQPGKSVEESFNIEYVRLQASREANAACEALFDSGADEVIVWDNHSRGYSLNVDLLDERVKIALGSTLYSRFPFMDMDVAGVVLIGYHAMEGTRDAVMAHTFSGKSYQWLKFDGREIGEIGFDAACAGRHDVPVIFVSSDSKGVAEARSFMPWIEAVETKESLAQTRIISLHPKEAVRRIYDGVCRAVEHLDRMQPFKLPEPVLCEVRFKRLDEAQSFRMTDVNGQGFSFVDAFTRAGVLHSHEDFVAVSPSFN